MAEDIFDDDGEGDGVPEGTGTATNTGRFMRGIRLLRGTVYGAGVWILGFVLSAVAATASSGAPALEGTTLGGEETFTLAGWVFYGGHMVSVELTEAGDTVLSTNVATEIGGVSAAMVVVVPVLLFLAGRKLGSGGWGWKAGSSMALGYFLFTAGAVFLFTKSGSPGLGTTTVSVGPKSSIAYTAGMLYPIVFGGLGAYFAD